MTTHQQINDMGWLHPSQLTDEQRREANARVLDRLARAHDRVADQGHDQTAQHQSATNARRAAAKIREHVETGSEHVARETYGDRVVDAWFRADGIDPDQARGHTLDAER